MPGLVGPAIAGFVAETWHWRFVFLGLLPLIAIAGGIAFGAMRDIPAAHGDAEANRAAAASARKARTRRYALAIATAAGAGVLMTGLLQTDVPVLLAMVALGAAIAGLAFHALTPAGTLRLARGYPAAVLLRGVIVFAFIPVDANVTLLLQEVRGWSAFAAGIALSAATISWSLGSWYQSRHSVRIGPERFVRGRLPDHRGRHGRRASRPAALGTGLGRYSVLRRVRLRHGPCVLAVRDHRPAGRPAREPGGGHGFDVPLGCTRDGARDGDCRGPDRGQRPRWFGASGRGSARRSRCASAWRCSDFIASGRLHADLEPRSGNVPRLPAAA